VTVLSAAPNMKDNNIITVQNLTKAFNGLIAVDQISLSVKAGEIIAFL